MVLTRIWLGLAWYSLGAGEAECCVTSVKIRLAATGEKLGKPSLFASPYKGAPVPTAQYDGLYVENPKRRPP